MPAAHTFMRLLELVTTATRQEKMRPALFSTPQKKPPKWRCKPFKTLGGNGYINDYPTGRLLRDAKLYEIGAGTSEIRRMLIGRELFRETA